MTSDIGKGVIVRAGYRNSCWRAVLGSALFVCVLACVGCMSHRITADELARDYKVIGRLGMPLGKVMHAGALIVSGDSVGDKRHDGQYLLDIQSLDGQLVVPPIRMEFRDASGRLPANVFARLVTVDDKAPMALSGKMKERINAGYVGSECDLLVYESGGFSGPNIEEVPDELAGQCDGYGFDTYYPGH